MIWRSYTTVSILIIEIEIGIYPLEYDKLENLIIK